MSSDSLQQRLGHNFADAALLRLALTHPSITHEQGAATQSNQRLEFLGDAVLGLVLARELYEKFPGSDEGVLTKARARLVNAGALAAHARGLGLGAHLILGRGEETSGGRDKPSALADAFEAVLGAIFLDGGFAAAREFILREFAPVTGEPAAIPAMENPKGELQELLQAASPEAPQYETLSTTGPDHAREFECKVSHAGVELGRGRGGSKKTAESAAALAALETLRAQE